MIVQSLLRDKHRFFSRSPPASGQVVAPRHACDKHKHHSAKHRPVTWSDGAWKNEAEVHWQLLPALSKEDNLQKWEDGKITASEKRILITKWVGEAWDIIFKSGKYNQDKFFEHTGCLLTLDGSEDHLIKIQRLPDYKPPPAPLAEQDVEEIVAESPHFDPPEPTIIESVIDRLNEDDISV